MVVYGIGMQARLVALIAGGGMILGLAACSATDTQELAQTEPLSLVPTSTGAQGSNAQVSGAQTEAGGIETATAAASNSSTSSPASAASGTAPSTTATVAPPETVAEIRKKAADSEANDPQEFPNVFVPASTNQPPPKTTAQVDEIITDLGNQGQNLDDVPTNASSQERALWLWRLGQTHIDAAESDIAQQSATKSQ